MSYLENLKKLKSELLEHNSSYVELSILSGKVNVERSTALHILDSAISTCELAQSLAGSQLDEYRRAIRQMIFKDLKEHIKTDLEVDVESLVGKLFRSNTYEAIEVYAVDHVGKYVYAEVVSNGATGRPLLNEEIKRYPGYSLDIKYGTPKKEMKKSSPDGAVSLIGCVFNSSLHGTLEVISVDVSKEIVHTKLTNKSATGRPDIIELLLAFGGFKYSVTGWSCERV